ncbi:hypothetical protein C8J57DRAFT_1516166 [Mycena rebaudengoi]|nr:hypothetical protein C8J57DRAFT_1516166 [Mycena rebaudengoi]
MHRTRRTSPTKLPLSPPEGQCQVHDAPAVIIPSEIDAISFFPALITHAPTDSRARRTTAAKLTSLVQNKTAVHASQPRSTPQPPRRWNTTISPRTRRTTTTPLRAPPYEGYDPYANAPASPNYGALRRPLLLRLPRQPMDALAQRVLGLDEAQGVRRQSGQLLARHVSTQFTVPKFILGRANPAHAGARRLAASWPTSNVAFVCATFYPACACLVAYLPHDVSDYLA